MQREIIKARTTIKYKTNLLGELCKIEYDLNTEYSYKIHHSNLMGVQAIIISEEACSKIISLKQHFRDLVVIGEHVELNPLSCC